MAVDLNVLGYGGILAASAVWVGKKLLERLFADKQTKDLYEKQKAAHEDDRKRFEEDRERWGKVRTQLEAEAENAEHDRKAAEMELRQTNIEHDKDRGLWRTEKQQTLDIVDTLKEEVRKLRQEVSELKTLTNQLNRRRNDHGGT